MKLEKIGSNGSTDFFCIEGDKTKMALRFTDYVSVFGAGRTPQKIPGKGASICECVTKSNKIARRMGVPTDFIERIDETTILVGRVERIYDRNPTMADEGYIVPVNWICRWRNVGSTFSGFQDARDNPEKYGFHAGNVLRTGELFPAPVHMFTRKIRGENVEVTEQEVCQLSGLTIKDVHEFWSMIDRLTGAIGYELFLSDFYVLDSRVQCIVGPGRKKMISAMLGNPDNDRWCIIRELNNGGFSYYANEYALQCYIKKGYYEALMSARRNGLPDLPIPDLSKEEVRELQRRYTACVGMYVEQPRW